jgi:NitT/TauT family transport system substrate-binding protein
MFVIFCLTFFLLLCCVSSHKCVCYDDSIVKMLRAVLIALAVSLVLVSHAACNSTGRQTPGQKVTVGVVPWPASTALYIAQEKGYFKDERLDVVFETFASGHLALAAVLEGKVTFAGCADTPIARAVVEGKKPAVIATISEINRAILIIGRKDRGISSVRDLRGKKIGLAGGSAAEYYLSSYLTAFMISLNNVQIVNVAADKVVEALVNGEVDAVSTWSPHTIVLLDRLGDNATVLTDPGFYVMSWNIVVTPEFARDNQKKVERFLRAVSRANDFIRKRPVEARAILTKHMGLESTLYEKEWQDYRFTLALEQGLILDLEDQARWMANGGITNAGSVPNFLDFIYAGSLRLVLPEAVRIAGK